MDDLLRDRLRVAYIQRALEAAGGVEAGTVVMAPAPLPPQYVHRRLGRREELLRRLLVGAGNEAVRVGADE
ncbi:hypothetical protein D3C72_2510870 [compost metagenome]